MKKVLMSFFKIFFFSFFFFYFIATLFIYYLFLAASVLVAVHGLSLVVVSKGYSYSSLRCAGFSLPWLLFLWSMGSRCAGFSSCGMRASVVVARGL